MVTGVRKDAWAKANPVHVERTKRRKDRGRFLNPEVHGRSDSTALGPTRLPRQRRRTVKRPVEKALTD
jgi:hypothetical protein